MKKRRATTRPRLTRLSTKSPPSPPVHDAKFLLQAFSSESQHLKKLKRYGDEFYPFDMIISFHTT
jgi:hypothetical protein